METDNSSSEAEPATVKAFDVPSGESQELGTTKFLKTSKPKPQENPANITATETSGTTNSLNKFGKEIDDFDVDACITHAKELESTGNYEEALTYFKRALYLIILAYGEADSTVASTHHHIGRIYAKLGNAVQALECFYKAEAIFITCGLNRETAPEVLYALYNDIGDAYTDNVAEQIKNYELSLDIANSGDIAIQEYPVFSEIFLKLGKAYLKVGNTGKSAHNLSWAERLLLLKSGANADEQITQIQSFRKDNNIPEDKSVETILQSSPCDRSAMEQLKQMVLKNQQRSGETAHFSQSSPTEDLVLELLEQALQGIQQGSADTTDQHPILFINTKGGRASEQDVHSIMNTLRGQGLTDMFAPQAQDNFGNLSNIISNISTMVGNLNSLLSKAMMASSSDVEEDNILGWMKFLKDGLTDYCHKQKVAMEQVRSSSMLDYETVMAEQRKMMVTNTLPAILKIIPAQEQHLIDNKDRIKLYDMWVKTFYEGYSNYANLATELDFHVMVSGLMHYRDLLTHTGHSVGYLDHVNKFPVSTIYLVKQLHNRYFEEGKAFAHFIFTESDTERIIDQAFGMLEYDEFVSAFTVRDYKNQLPLHYGASKGRIQPLKSLVEKIKKPDLVAMLTSKSIDGSTALHAAAAKQHWEVVELLIQSVDYACRFEMLSSINFLRQSPALLMTAEHGIFTHFMKMLTDEERAWLLQVTLCMNKGITFLPEDRAKELHILSKEWLFSTRLSSVEYVSPLHISVKNCQWIELKKASATKLLTADHGVLPMQLAARMNPKSFLDVVRSLLLTKPHDDVREVLIAQQECNGNTLLHELMKSSKISNLMALIEILPKDILAELLNRTNKIGLKPAQSSPDASSLQDYLRWVEMHKNWCLFHSPPIALVVYGSGNGEGGKEHAEQVVNALRIIGLNADAKECASKDQFFAKVKKTIKNNQLISGFVLVLMSKGGASQVNLSDGPEGVLNFDEMFRALNTKALHNKPKVVAIQTYMGIGDTASTGEADSPIKDQPTADSAFHNFDVVNKDMFVLSAAVSCQLTEPNIMLPVLCNELIEAEELIDFDGVCNKVKYAVENKYPGRVRVMVKNTAKKKLSLKLVYRC